MKKCKNCVDGRWETECCSGANSCDCHGKVIDMGTCHVCGGLGYHDESANVNANRDSIRGRCFIGSGPTFGYWAGK